MPSGLAILLSSPPPPPNPQLPTEVILHIISQLDQKLDKTTLSACSLINSSTRGDAQRYLFASVKLVIIFRRKKDPFLLEAICHNIPGSTVVKSARIASYVRRLEIQLHNVLSPDTSTDPEEAFPWVLQRFQHLQELSLYSNMIWSRFDLTTTRAIQSLLKANPLRSIFLRGNHAIPLELMYDCSRLRQLTIWAMTSIKEEGPVDPTRSTIPLSTLILRCQTDTEGLLTLTNILEHVQASTCPLTLSFLTTLIVHQQIERARFISLISTALSLCASTLTRLTFPVPRAAGVYNLEASATPSEISDTFPILDLSCLSNLSELYIANGVVKSNWIKEDSDQDISEKLTASCLMWVGAVLSTLPQQCERADFHFKLKLRVTNVSAKGIELLPWRNIVEPLFALKTGPKQYRSPCMLLDNMAYSRSAITALGAPERMQSTLEAIYENLELRRLGGEVNIEAISIVEKLPGRFAIIIKW